MKKTTIFCILQSVFCLVASAQDIKHHWFNCPDSVAMFLNREQRLRVAEMADSLSTDYLRMKLSDVLTTELQLSITGIDTCIVKSDTYTTDRTIEIHRTTYDNRWKKQKNELIVQKKIKIPELILK